LLRFFQLVTAQVREKYNFNPDWKLKVFDDSLASQPNYTNKDWERITLPDDWNEALNAKGSLAIIEVEIYKSLIK